jgi:hypothetical protein
VVRGAVPGVRDHAREHRRRAPVVHGVRHHRRPREHVAALGPGPAQPGVLHAGLVGARGAPLRPDQPVPREPIGGLGLAAIFVQRLPGAAAGA